MTRQIVYACARLGRDVPLQPEAVTVWWTTDGPVAEIRCECGDWHFPTVCGPCALALILAGADVEHEIPEMADRARGAHEPLSLEWIEDQVLLMEGRPGEWLVELVRLRDLTRAEQ